MGRPESTVIECRGVSKHYGALAAVDGIDVKIDANEIVGIGGPNGAGKTTFFDLISGLTPVSHGEVLFNGRPTKGRPPHLLFHEGLARTFQVTSGFGSLTVLQNMLVSVVNGSNTLVSDIPIIARKKLMVASAVVHNPKVLLLDEPVGGLMPREVDEFIALMAQLQARGISIVFIEHVMRFLTAVAGRALIMHQGKLIYDGAPNGIADDDTVRSVYLGSAGLAGH
jgi:branched-chain amino acid transport system ATP-binding protein